MKSLISIVMPVYNEESYLKECIESVLNQSFVNFEFLIIDDGSQDKSSVIINEYMKLDCRIKYYRKENTGITDTLNFGLSKAVGKYICRMDSDDIMHKTRLQKQFNFMEKNKYVQVLGSNAVLIDKFNKQIRIKRLPSNPGDIFCSMFFEDVIIHPTSFFRKDIFKNSQYYNANYKVSQDYELWTRIINETNFYNLKCNLIKYRIHSNNITSRRTKEQRCNSVKIKKAFYEKHINNISEKNIEDIFINNNIFLLEKYICAIRNKYPKYSKRLAYYWFRYNCLSSEKNYKKFKKSTLYVKHVRNIFFIFLCLLKKNR